MSFITISTNMNLPVPNVGQEPGPEWANDINNCLALIDGHDHSNGNGVKITPSGLNINSTLTFQGNSATSLLSLDLQSQSAVISNLVSIYSVNGNLWFNDNLGNNIQITASGGVAGTPGNITNLVPPAAVTYVGGNDTFVFTSSANFPANMDFGTFIVRDEVGSSHLGITIQAPVLGAAYSITLPSAPPSQQSFMTMDAAGAIAAPWTVDNTTIKIVANQLVAQPGALGVGQEEHAWELNGAYPLLTYPLTNIDSIFFAPYNLVIQSVWIYNGTAGTSGNTQYDLKVASPGGSFTTILSTVGQIASTAATNIWTDSGTVVGVQTGVTKPVISTVNITAGQAIRFDLLTSMTGTATDARIRVFYKPA